MHATPDSFRFESEPPGRLPPAPGSCVHRSASLPKLLCGRSGPAILASTFIDFRMVCFSLAGVLTVNSGHTTLLSIAVCRCRPAASSVCMLPLSLQVRQYSPVMPGLLSVHSLLRASLSPELRRLSSITRFPPTDFQPHGSQCSHRPMTCLASSSAVCSGLHTPLLTSHSSATWPPTILCQESHPTRRCSGTLQVALYRYPVYRAFQLA
jgi:hypothetical protein